MAYNWTPEAENDLRKRWLAGLPTAKIAQELDPVSRQLSKSAVISRARKLGLGPHPAKAAPVAAPEPEAPAAAPAPLHETREGWLLAFWRTAKPIFGERLADVEGYNADVTIRISVGWPSAGFRSKVIGECWHAEASADAAREIFIRPSLLASVSEIAEVLTHELIHAVLPDGEAHGKHFKRSCKQLGLEGPAKATHGGDVWKEWALPIIEALGAFPGAALNGLPAGKKKQTTRQLKLACTNEDCGFICRASAKQIDAHEVLICPTECGGLLVKED